MVKLKGRTNSIYNDIKIKVYLIYCKIIMTYKQFVKQIYLNTLISNKLYNIDHSDLVCIIKICTQCAYPIALPPLTIYDHVV